MGRPINRDLTGLRVGQIWVLGRAGSEPGSALWACRCDCGNVIVRRGGDLNRGHVKSCGCFKITNLKKIKTSHGMRDSALYVVWAGMINRCHNPNQPHYARYGGRGIYVCDEWRASFAAFYRDMGDRPEGPKRYTIDRVDNDGPYSKKNCRWATYEEQQKNVRPKKSKYANEAERLAAKRDAYRRWADRDKLGLTKKRNGPLPRQPT